MSKLGNALRLNHWPRSGKNNKQTNQPDLTTEPALPNADRSPSFGSRCCGPVRKKSKKKKRVWSQEQMKHNTHVAFGHEQRLLAREVLVKSLGPPRASTQDALLSSSVESKWDASSCRVLCAFSAFFPNLPRCPEFCGQRLTLVK